jgi:hypothetical protein
MTLTLPATYLVELVEQRLPKMLPEASDLAFTGTDLKTGDKVVPYYDPAADPISWCVYTPQQGTRRALDPRAAAHQFQTTHQLILRLKLASNESGATVMFGAYPRLYYILAPTVIAYFDERSEFSYADEIPALPLSAPKSTYISDATWFGDDPGGSYPFLGIAFTLNVAFNVTTEPVFNNR